MNTRTNETAEPISSDSFLDVITNVVGIMIVLVVIVGVRAGQTAAQSAAADVARNSGTRNSDAARPDQEAQLTDSVRELSSERRQLIGVLQVRNLEREQLLGAIRTADQEISAERAKLDEKSQRRFDQEQIISAAKAELTRLDQERVAALNVPKQIEKVTHTPLSKQVDGDEVHFQLRHSRIAYVPIEELVKKLRYQLDDKQRELPPSQMAHFSGTLGPTEGFRMRFQFSPVGPNRAAASFEMLPERADLGETLNDALADNSSFRRWLAKSRPRTTTVTLWTYPDCDHEYQTLNKLLHEMGYGVAGRPMPDDVNISGGPDGTASAAQ